jgi:fumarate hydratase subunit alpha
VREINAREVTRIVASLFYKANYHLADDVLEAIKKSLLKEESPVARRVLEQIIRNAEIAAEEKVPLCQDCGIAVLFIELGQDVHITGGDFIHALNEGVIQAYRDGYLRKSMVKNPFSKRQNTGDNTPAVVHVEIVPGEQMRIIALPKGGGAENMSRLIMLTPADGRNGIIESVVKTVDDAGPNPCGPVIVGVGIGGTAEKTMLMAKKALIRKIGEHHSDPEVAALEEEILARINALGIGPMGYGGRTTALAVNVEVFPAHIASLPVAVNLNCHSARHVEAIL